MNIDKIKKEFPIFDEKIQNNDLVYLDSANSSQKPRIVLDRINDFYSKQFSNVGRSVHYLAVAATNLYENTRFSVQKYINAKDKNEIVFTKGATEALNLVANTLGQTILEPNDEAIFYLMSRGLNYQQSRELLINGFLLDVVEKITDSEIKNLIKNMIGIKE